MPQGGLKPDAAVIVATIRALKMHGGVARDDLGIENVGAVQEGIANLKQHIENVKKFGVPPVVAINRFSTDTDAEIAAVADAASEAGADVVECTHWADGSAGTEALAHKVVEIADSGRASFAPVYPDDIGLFDKINTVARKSTARRRRLRTRACMTSSNAGKMKVTDICRSAWRRRNTVFRQIPT